jgi:septal ring factor EnvC (AmiA/AmiB activator)
VARLDRLAAACGRLSRTLHVTPMNLRILHHVSPWKPGDVVPAQVFTREQLAWLKKSAAVEETVLEVTVPNAPVAPLPVAEVSDKDAEILALRAQIGTAPAELARLKAELASAQTDAQEYEAMVGELEAKVKGLEAQLADTRHELLAVRSGGQPKA